MNKKGFTLIEILAVIVLMSVLAVVGYAGTRGIQKSINKKEYEAKIEILKNAAIDYGENNFEKLKEEDMTVTVKDLYLYGYIDVGDVKSKAFEKCKDKSELEQLNCIIADPTNENKYLCGFDLSVVGGTRVKAEYSTGLC